MNMNKNLLKAKDAVDACAVDMSSLSPAQLRQVASYWLIVLETIGGSALLSDVQAIIDDRLHADEDVEKQLHEMEKIFNG